MSLSAAVIDALVASGATAEQLAAAMKASLAEQEARKEAKRANNAERQRRFKARHRAEGNADNALPDVTDVITPAPSFPPNPPNTPTPVSNNKPAREKAGQGTRLADDFAVPEDWVLWAMKERGWSKADAEAEAANFVDYWHAKPGKDGRKSDWPATWRNWVRNSRRASVVPFQRGGAPPGGGQTLADVILSRQAQGSA